MSTFGRPDLTRRTLLGVGTATMLFGTGHAGDSAQDWDSLPETRPAGDAVAASLLRGPQYQVGPTATVTAFQDQFIVTSDFGYFTPSSDTMLRRLVREIAAIGALKQMQSTDMFGKAAKEAAKSSYRSAQRLISNPVDTLSAIPDGVASIFNRGSEQVRRGKSKYEDNSAKELLAVSSYKREYAKSLGVDVYSTNQALQDQLDRLAWASAAGNLTLGAASIATGAIVLQAASNIRTLEQARNVVEAVPASELARRNRAALHKFGVADPVTSAFLADHALSPRHQTIITASIGTLGGIPGQAAFIKYAAQAKSESQAFFFQQAAELLAGYSATVARIVQIGIFQNLPVGFDAGGKAVLMLPIDRLLWTPRTSGLAAQIASALPKAKPVRSVEVWITGTASAKAAAGVGALGLGLTQRCSSRINLLD